MKSKIMSALENALNGGQLSYSSGKVKCLNDFFQRAHRYLQEEFFKLVMTYIKMNAYHYNEQRNKYFDGRNELSGQICAKICDMLPEFKLFKSDTDYFDREENNFKWNEPDNYVNLKEEE